MERRFSAALCRERSTGPLRRNSGGHVSPGELSARRLNSCMKRMCCIRLMELMRDAARASCRARYLGLDEG